MKAIKLLVPVMTLLGAMLSTSCSTSSKTVDNPAARDVLYVCNCGPDCKCNSGKTEPGNCTCGKALKVVRALKVEDDTALACGCGPECKCSYNEKDPTKCGCGEPIVRVNLKGTGIYFCNCGGSCLCNNFSASPGNCECGMALKQTD